MKTYRRHRCERTHRTTRTFARCLWPRAHWILGDGQYASVSYCRGVTTVLHATAEQAEAAKRVIDATACGGACSRRHDVIRLDLGRTAVTAGRTGVTTGRAA